MPVSSFLAVSALLSQFRSEGNAVTPFQGSFYDGDQFCNFKVTTSLVDTSPSGIPTEVPTLDELGLVVAEAFTNGTASIAYSIPAENNQFAVVTVEFVRG